MTTETMMTEPAATTTEGTPASPPADQTTATAAASDGQQQQANAGTDAAATATEQAAAQQEQKPTGAPESYEFTAPEGQAFDPGVIGAFSEVAKELDMPQDAAQKVLDKMAPVLASRQAEQIESVRAEWRNSAKADKEFGGDKLPENLALAKKARDSFGTPELLQLLEESGLGDHPEVVRFFFRTGKAISEDRFVGGSAGDGKANDPRRLYAASNMNP